MTDVIPFPSRGPHLPEGSGGYRPPVRVKGGRVWATGARVEDVVAALAGWDTLTRLNPSGTPTEAPTAIPTPRGDDAS